jgi:hypothetical protein
MLETSRDVAETEQRRCVKQRNDKLAQPAEGQRCL